jgi:hypothetical protein
MQLRKYSKKTFKTELQKKPKTNSKVLEKPAILSCEELGGLSDPGLRGCVLEKPAILSCEELGGLSDPGLRGCVHNVV